MIALLRTLKAKNQTNSSIQHFGKATQHTVHKTKHYNSPDGTKSYNELVEF